MLFGKKLKRLYSKVVEENTFLNEMVQRQQRREKELIREAVQFESKITQLENEIAMLNKKTYEIPETFNFKAVMKDVADNAWYGKGETKREFRVIGNNISLVFCGHVYEPSYECFTAGCDVYAIENGKKQILYSIDGRNVAAYQNKTVESGSYDDIAKFIQEKCRIGFVETDCASA